MGIHPPIMSTLSSGGGIGREGTFRGKLILSTNTKYKLSIQCKWLQLYLPYNPVILELLVEKLTDSGKVGCR